MIPILDLFRGFTAQAVVPVLDLRSQMVPTWTWGRVVRVPAGLRWGQLLRVAYSQVNAPVAALEHARSQIGELLSKMVRRVS